MADTYIKAWRKKVKVHFWTVFVTEFIDIQDTIL